MTTVSKPEQMGCSLNGLSTHTKLEFFKKRLKKLKFEKGVAA
jgi:hypothetical protein